MWNKDKLKTFLSKISNKEDFLYGRSSAVRLCGM